MYSENSKSENHSNPKSISSMESLLLNFSSNVFFSAQLVAFWPISIRKTQQFEYKTLNRSLRWNRGVLISAFFLSLNLIYFVAYFKIKANEYFNYAAFIRYDLTWVIVWDSICLVTNTSLRVYSFMKLSEFSKFFSDIVNLVECCSVFVPDSEIMESFRGINKWARKFIWIAFSVGLVHIFCYVHQYVMKWEYKKEGGLFVAAMNVYMEVNLVCQNSHSLFLIFFIRVITFGFEVVSRGLQRMSRVKFYQEQMTIETLQKLSDRLSAKTFSRVQQSSPSANLQAIFHLINLLERLVNQFNSLFAPGMIAEGILTICQLIFSVYFLHTDPRMSSDIFWAITFITPFILFPMSFISLCHFSSTLTMTCQQMLPHFEDLPFSLLSKNEDRKVQYLVTRLQTNPPVIHVWQLFKLRGSLICSAINALATYMVVFIQMRDLHKSRYAG
ncbi:unnamed protein product [Orchesella dallaii]|uniref:Gustatory receptor n=1 Tax=Orchesella dallaii TaxID=48710 RepID=A0ABP1R0H5_9HEXA